MDDRTAQQAAAPSFGEFARAFARIGLLSFGGPAAQISLMHHMLVDEKRWIREDRYLHALSYCMLLPGPEAQQLATYIGWLMFGWRGGIVAGLLFVLPGLALILALSTVYALFQDAHWLTGIFFGLKAAVLAIVVQAVMRLGTRALKTPAHRVIAGAAFAGLFFLSLPFPLVVGAAALAGILITRRAGVPTPEAMPGGEDDSRPLPLVTHQLRTLLIWIAVWQAPLLVLVLLGDPAALSAPFMFFSQMAMVTFGGAYAVLAYVAQVAVDHYHWLKPSEMIDGLALAETTPGPLVLVLSFVGYLAGFRAASGADAIIAGLAGGLLTAWATFVPSFIWIFAGAPYIEGLRGNRLLSAALAAITAAVVGVILNLALWFALHVLFGTVETRILIAGSGPLPDIALVWPRWASVDLAAVGIFALSLVLLFRLRFRVEILLAVAAVLGFAIKLAEGF